MVYTSAITASINNPRLHLLNALRAGTKLIMTFLGLPSFRSTQVVAQTGFDRRFMHSSTAAIASLAVSPPIPLDAGAHGIVVPQINTAEEDKAVVSHSKFPPQANETLIICLQIESKVGVENVDSICAVPGVDMVFIGPNYLALSILGYVPAKGSEPTARKHGIWVGRLSNDGASSKEHLKVFDTVALS
ncbi:Pyruvate/Phosphoenolpyruvate kinase-like domain-containing protein [Aspergillus alliaceus]|uniref:Pyruvate/Phosphoenolpyruvate kinase-like domain-containing protein n=1 Tax=Petromyces alliaceus TaxID=209559 RepID=UPI0012A436F7|nr:Pyruvate/Phosphoenolpyruvate kinase-like domain-containing protein [Aspergillus alliaceus]KAB8227189.1 Pyruvate/Phosphoenolpyruvate kinase-like domain-containing protein [Aspergillus alliaceus]